MTDRSEIVDLAVIGLGAMGAAVAYQGAQRGLSVVGIDRYCPPHELGSSHAETRVTRLAVGEGVQYLPIVRRSHSIWRELENTAGTTLLHETGGYVISPSTTSGQRWSDFVTATANAAVAGGLSFEHVAPSEARRRHPTLRIGDHEQVGFEPTAGIVMAEDAIRTQLKLAASFGADLRPDTTLHDVRSHRGGVEITTSRGEIHARHVVMATGAWLPSLLPEEMRRSLTVTRQVVYWFDVDDETAFSVDRLPVGIWARGSMDEYVGFFPIPPSTTRPGAFKVLGEQFDEATTPDDVDRSISPDEIADFHRRNVAPRFEGVSDRCVDASVCLYTNTPNDDFLITAHPEFDSVTVMSPCSGHGFKHSAALGEAVVDRITQATPRFDLSPFAQF